MTAPERRRDRLVDQAEAALARLAADPRDPSRGARSTRPSGARPAAAALDRPRPRAARRHDAARGWVERLRRDHLDRRRRRRSRSGPSGCCCASTCRPTLDDLHAIYGRADVADVPAPGRRWPRAEFEELLRRARHRGGRGRLRLRARARRPRGRRRGADVPRPDQAELVWVVHPDVGGRGHRHRGDRGRCSTSASATTRFHRIFAELDARNTASRGSASGSACAGSRTGSQDYWSKGEWTDSLQYAVLASEWRADGEGPAAASTRVAAMTHPERPRRRQRGRPAPDRDAAPPRRRAEAADPAQQRQAALRRHPVGGAGPGRARRVRRRAARARRRGALPHRAADRDPASRRAPATTRSPPRCPGSTSATRCAPTSRRALSDASPGRAHGVPHRRHPQRRGARRPRPGDLAARPARLPDRPAAQPAVHPRLQRLGARPGRGHVAGDARPAPRDPADRADLHRAPALRRHPQDPRLAPRARRGRRRAAARARRDRRRRRRADHARRRGAARPPGLPRPAGPHRARGPDRAGAGDDAPRHGLHDGRRRQDRDVPQRRRLAPGVRRHGAGPRRGRGHR